MSDLEISGDSPSVEINPIFHLTNTEEYTNIDYQVDRYLVSDLGDQDVRIDGRRNNGRPSKLGPYQVNQIRELIDQTPYDISATEILKFLKFNVSSRTIRRIKKKIIERRHRRIRTNIIIAARSMTTSSTDTSNQQ